MSQTDYDLGQVVDADGSVPHLVPYKQAGGYLIEWWVYVKEGKNV